ncbi:MAG: helix-turn-helix protein, partial [Chloroflexota bacterium]|nr:helix-turn-helix protein [Chloroflexota bacterium]
MFTEREVSSLRDRASQRTEQLLVVAGAGIRAERVRRGWTLRDLGRIAGVSPPAVHGAENGHGSLEMIVGLGAALGLSLEMELVDRRRRERVQAVRQEDPVHAAMGELEAGHLRRLGFSVAIDEPYQHYQFAGRADLLAWSVEDAALLHLENRTAFPNIQDAMGSFGAKRAYLAHAIAVRLGVRHFRSETHVMVCLWSSDVLHALRLRHETFRSACPDPAVGFASWWGGTPPPSGRSSSLVVLDPFAAGRQRQWIDLETALAGARPRMAGYAEA